MIGAFFSSRSVVLVLDVPDLSVLLLLLLLGV